MGNKKNNIHFIKEDGSLLLLPYLLQIE